MKISNATVQVLNKNFQFNDLKRQTKNREKISGIFKSGVMTFIANQCDCVQKIFYSNGKNGYHYFAPVGFLASFQILESANLNTYTK
jgi:hypothetical protein